MARLAHLSPLGWEHNLTGDYNWRQNKQVEQGDFCPLPPLVGVGQARMEK